MKRHYHNLLAFLLIVITFIASGQSWSTAGLGVNGPVYAMTVYDSALYVGGQFDSAGGVPALNIAKWDGKKWSAVGSGASIWEGQASITSFLVHNNKLIVGGVFDTIDNVPANSIAEWNGKNWNALGNTYLNGITALLWYDSILYAGSEYNSKGSINMGQWNGTSWSTLAGGTVSLTAIDRQSCIQFLNIASVNALAIYNNELVIGGFYVGVQSAFGNTNTCGASIAGWDGVSWNNGFGSFSAGNPDATVFLDGFAYNVSAILNYNGRLYTGGNFHSANGVNCIAEWNGYEWIPLGYGINPGVNSTGIVNALTQYKGNIYAAGSFSNAYAADQMHYVNANSIVTWTDSSWVALGNGVEGTVSAMVEYNGDLYVGGAFTAAGGNQASNIARWTEPDKQTALPQTVNAVLYPNPNKGDFYFSTENYPSGCHAEVYNALGQKLCSESLSFAGITEINMENHLSAGMYMYRILSGTGNILSSGKFQVL